MSYIQPVECTLETKCITHDCVKAGDCLTVRKTEGESRLNHNIESEQTITVGGIPIPTYLCSRQFSVTYGRDFPVPNEGSLYYYTAEDGASWVECGERSKDNPYCSVSENCAITQSTIHYLDLRYGVALFCKRKWEIKLYVESPEIAKIKERWGIFDYHQVQIKTSNYNATNTEEWHFIRDGVDTILSSCTKEIEPFGPRNNGLSMREMGRKTGLFLDYKPDKETRKVLLFPQPPSEGMPWSDVIVRLGFYDYGHPPGEESELNRLDGGCKHMFYPEWCRSLAIDPFWRFAADRRYMITWWHDDLMKDTSFIPPSPLVDPMPRGTFAKHPKVGDVYQWLIETLDNQKKVSTSPDFNHLIDAALPDGLDTHGTTLYYPIGVI